MKIRTTLTAGCFVFAMITGAVGFFGERAITSISGKFDAVADEVLPVTEILDDIRYAGLRVVSSTTEYALLVRQDSRGATETAIIKDAGGALYRNAIGRLKVFAARLHPDERKLMADIERSGDRLLATSEELVKAIRRGGAPADLALLRERFELEARLFYAAVASAHAHEKEELAETKAEVRSSISRARITLYVASTIAFILAVTGGSLGAVLITRPIDFLREGVERVRRGLLDTRIPVEANNEIGLLASAFNRMTVDLRAAEDEIVTARNHLDNIIRSMADALIVLAPDGTITSVNPALCALLGYRETELEGRPFTEIVHDRERGEELLREMIEQGKVPDRELLYRAKGGESIPVELAGSVMRAASGELRGIVCLAHDIRERKRAEGEIRQLAYFDSLTGLPNRTLFRDRLAQALGHACRVGEKVALLFLDLDRFKDVNDTLGHACGDQLLAAVAERLKRHLRTSDTLARLGGDEFVVILTGIREARDAAVVAQTILDLLASPFTMEEKEIFISTSVGIALFPDDGEEGDTLFRHADMALYAAKERGRNAFSFFSDEMNLRARERRGLEESLRRALAGGEFFLEYQPQVDLRCGRLFGVEALLRWRHPEEGVIPPERFIPVAEDTGLIRAMGEWVIRAACLQGRKWQEAGHPPVRVAVNVSGHQFNQPGFIDLLDRVLDETGLDPTLLELELTESTLMKGAEETIMTLIDLKVRGIHLAIDDFGTGYSSLSYLKHFPIDRLKIDRSFVRDIATDLDDCAIVEAIIVMAHSLGRRVLAEGVEREAELVFLRERGCDEAQGFHFGRPMAPDEVETLFAGIREEQPLYLGAEL